MASRGKDGQRVPEMTDAVVTSISDRYRELYAQVTGEKAARHKL